MSLSQRKTPMRKRKTTALALLALCFVGAAMAVATTPAQAWTCRFGMFGTYVECKGSAFCAAGVVPTNGGWVVGCVGVDVPY
jgi:hypothetical protein